MQTALCTFSISYSCPNLVRPKSEELISRPFVGETQFQLVLQKRMGSESAIGCFFSSTRYFCFAPHMHTASARTWAFPEGFVQKQVEWISHQTNPIDLLLNKSFWKRPCPRGCCVQVWGKKKVPGG